VGLSDADLAPEFFQERYSAFHSQDLILLFTRVHKGVTKKPGAPLLSASSLEKKSNPQTEESGGVTPTNSGGVAATGHGETEPSKRHYWLKSGYNLGKPVGIVKKIERVPDGRKRRP